MYKLENIKDIHLELTSKCQARCPMCPRRVNGGILNPIMSLNEITLEQFKEWFSDEFINQLDSLFMCGNLGCLLYTSASPRDGLLSRMPSSA